jgi:hypothetical protein
MKENPITLKRTAGSGNWEVADNVGISLQRIRSAFRFSTILIFFVFFFISFLQRHVYNYDFWWHLATGKYIVENASLPHDDPFSYTTHSAPSERKSIILKGNWLAEVIFYKIYDAWDLKGIIILRALLMLVFLFFILLAIRVQGVSGFLALVLVTDVFFLSMDFIGERPQLFTFAAFSAVLYLLEDFRKNGSRKVFLIPLIMVPLSNMHPGYIVCILLVSLHTAGAGTVALLVRDSRDHKSKRLLAVWFLAIIASFFNPAGLGAVRGIFSISTHTVGIVEFMAPFSVYLNKFKPPDYSYIAFLALSLFGLRYLKRIGLVPLMVLGVFTFMSFIAIRYMIFYMCAAAPVIANILMNIKEERIWKGRCRMFRGQENVSYAIAFVAGVALVFSAIPSLARYEFRADTSYAAPKGASDFLVDLKISGNMFNEYGSGGYLIWRLYPDKKVFIDGRSLEPDVYGEYRIVISAGEEQGHSWEDILRKYGVSYIITPPLLPRGEIYPVVEKLLERDDWVLVYRDQLSLIFFRNAEENLTIIRRFALDKSEALNTIIIQASARATKNTANPYYLLTLGKVFLRKGNLDDAEKAFEMAHQRDPKNPIINEWRRKMKENAR